MSSITNAIVVTNDPTPRTLERINEKLRERDEARQQSFGRVDTESAGGTKILGWPIGAAAFNHLSQSDVLDVVRANVWEFGATLMLKGEDDEIWSTHVISTRL